MSNARFTFTLVTASALALVACGSNASDASKAASIDDPMTTPASRETTAALGVATWGVRPDGDAQTRYTGYDAAGNPRLTFTQRTTFDATHRGEMRVDFAEPGAAGATMHFAYDGSTFRMDENTFAGNDVALQAATRFQADLKASPLKETSGLTDGTSLTQSLKPMDVKLTVGNDQCLLVDPDCLAHSGAAGYALYASLGTCGLVATAGVMVLVCQVGGGGPEDPLSDVCSAAAGTVASKAAVECGGLAITAGALAFDAKNSCVKKCNEK